jgi:hypothetical protein
MTSLYSLYSVLLIGLLNTKFIWPKFPYRKYELLWIAQQHSTPIVIEEGKPLYYKFYAKNYNRLVKSVIKPRLPKYQTLVDMGSSQLDIELT